KNNGLFTKSFKVYLKLGSTSNSQAVDLITPTNSGTFNGTWSHTNKGSVATTAGHFQTGFVPFDMAGDGANDIGVTVSVNQNVDSSETYPNPVGAYGGFAAKERLQFYSKYGSITKTGAAIGNLLGDVTTGG